MTIVVCILYYFELMSQCLHSQGFTLQFVSCVCFVYDSVDGLDVSCMFVFVCVCVCMDRMVECVCLVVRVSVWGYGWVVGGWGGPGASCRAFVISAKKLIEHGSKCLDFSCLNNMLDILFFYLFLFVKLFFYMFVCLPF